jgi:hypothetical protein
MSEVNENQPPGTPTWLDLHVPEDTPYGRSATLTDPFGVEYSIIARPA